MERLAIFDDNGKDTGKTIIRGDKNVNLTDHEHIATAVIYIENSKGEFLIQKTSKEKGGNYSSTGGHVDSGETPLKTIIREVKEELGIDISNDNIIQLGYLLYDKPLRYMFYLKKDIDLKDIKAQTEEVDYVTYKSISEIQKLIDEGKMTKSHGIIFSKILEYKNSQKENL